MRRPFSHTSLLVPLLLAICAVAVPPLLALGKGAISSEDDDFDGSWKVPPAPKTRVSLPPPVSTSPELPASLEAAPPASKRQEASKDAQALARSIMSFYKDHPNKRIHVQLDKPLYRPGESVWIKAWDLQVRDLSSEKLAYQQGVTYELINPRGESVAKKLVGEREGSSTNDLLIPADARGGEWTLRASSAEGVRGERSFIVLSYEQPRIRKRLEFLRKAYGPGDEVSATLSLLRPNGESLANASFEAVIQLDGQDLPRVRVQTDDKGEGVVRFVLPPSIELGDGLLTVLVPDGGVTESISRRVPIVIQGMKMTFYPEGGDLVLGLPSRVYFEANDVAGKPADIEGRVVDDLGREMSSFRSFDRGLGRFDLVPEEGRSYHVELTRPVGIEQRFALPKALPEGCVLRAFDDLDSSERPIRVAVRCTESQEILVTAAVRENLIDAAQARVRADTASVFYLESQNKAFNRLPGVARVTVFSLEDPRAQAAPLAERVVFRNRKERLKVEIEPQERSLGPRDEVHLRVRTRDAAGRPVPAELALSVVDDTVLSFADDKKGNIHSRLLLEPELQGEIEEPNFYLDLEKPESAFALDLLMGTRGWRRFEWRPVLEDWSGGLSGAPESGASSTVKTSSKTSNLAKGATEAPKAEDLANALGRELPKAPQQQAPQAVAIDKEIADNAGVLGALRPEMDYEPLAMARPAPDEPAPAAPLAEDLAQGIGGLIGAEFGADEAGEKKPKEKAERARQNARGDGLGGGGTAEGIGGLGTRGPGLMAGGYGAGGGNFGSKATSASSVVVSQPIILGALDRTLIDTVIRRHLNQIRYCYQRELTRRPDLAGKVLVKFVISPDGSVSSANIKSSTLRSPEVENCLVTRFQRMQFPSAKGGGIVIVTYPFLFKQEGDHESPPQVSYAPVRSFPVPQYKAASAWNQLARSDFRDTIYWNPSVKTNASGEATLSFPLSDAVTTFRAVAEGVGAGRTGRGERELSSRLPFSMVAKVPLELSAGDRVILPLTFTNERSEGLDVALSAEIGEGLRPREELPALFTLEGRSSRSLFHALDVVATEGKVPLRLSARSQALDDSYRREVTVVPAGFPATWSGSSQLAESSVHSFELKDLVDGTLHASLELYPNPLGELISGLEGMLRLPAGCFEQASSSNYPNVMILRYLEREGKADLALQERTRKYLEEGYRRLSGFESKSGGYEWFGADPGHEALTSYGLLQFHDMMAVYEGMDASLLSRATSWLGGKKNAEGGFSRNPKALDTFGRASEEVTEAYILHGITEAGLASGFEAQLKKQARVARETPDAYVLALAANSLLSVPSLKADGQSAARRLVDMQEADGSWKKAKESITRSMGKNLEVETTALALLALMKSGEQEAAVLCGMKWLYTSRDGSGRWGSTQATVLSLRALDRFAEKHARSQAPGRVELRINGQAAGSLAYGPEDKGAVRLDGLEKYLQPGANKIELGQAGGTTIPYTLSASYRTRTPVSDPTAVVDLLASLQKTTLPMGETVRMNVVLRNVTSAGQPMTIARVGIPAGLSFQSWQLDDLKDRGAFDFYETRAREIYLYWRALEPKAEKTVGIDLVAEVPGSYVAPASSAYLYYTDDVVVWREPLRVEIVP